MVYDPRTRWASDVSQAQGNLFEKPVEKGAVISDDGLYRYRLWRIWDHNLPVMVWVMLNPSTADAKEDDATIRRCIGFAKQWGYGGIEVINLFALRSTDPKGLKEGPVPVGPDNASTFYETVDRKPKLIVAAWGNNVPPGYDVHVNAIRGVLRSNEAQCLGHTRSGEPKHPVRLPYSTRLRPF